MQNDAMAVVLTAFVMIDRKGERPRKIRETVLVRADNGATSPGQGGVTGGKDEGEGMALMRMLDALEARGGGVVSGKVCAGG